MNAQSPWERRLCFAPPFLMRMLVLILRCFGIGGGSPDALLHIVLQVKIYIYILYIYIYINIYIFIYILIIMI